MAEHGKILKKSIPPGMELIYQCSCEAALHFREGSNVITCGECGTRYKWRIMVERTVKQPDKTLYPR